MKKYGYVIEMRKTSFHYPGFYNNNFRSYAGSLRTAAVFSRNDAYKFRYDNETVRKAELFKNGKPKRIVERTTK